MVRGYALVFALLLHTAFAGENLVKEGLGEFAGGMELR